MLHEMESSSHQQCLESTRTTWIAELVAWAKSDSVQNVLWINGIPGSGKSTLAQTIARHEDILLMLISHIFFKRESTSRHDILLLIAYRLAERNAKIAEEIAARAHRRTLTLRDTFVNLLEPLKAAERERGAYHPPRRSRQIWHQRVPRPIHAAARQRLYWPSAPRSLPCYKPA